MRQSGIPYCGFSAGSEAEVDEHIVEVHLGIRRAPLVSVMLTFSSAST